MKVDSLQDVSLWYGQLRMNLTMLNISLAFNYNSSNYLSKVT